MERCKSCKFYDEKMSNENWVVCSKIPLEVMISGTSKNCKEYDNYNIEHQKEFAQLKNTDKNKKRRQNTLNEQRKKR